MLRKLRDLAYIGLALAGEAADRWLDGPALRNRITELSTRVRELELENDGLRFNGPTLFSDEVRALNYADSLMDQDHVAAYTRDHRKALRSLLDRSDHWPDTREEFERRVTVDPSDPTLEEWK